MFMLMKKKNVQSLDYVSGVPLLEENEAETEGSNSSSVSGDTGSATYSEGRSSKNN